MTWRSKLIEALALIVAVAVVARVVWGLLGPLLPSLAVAMFVAGVLFMLLRGPHANR